MMVDVEILKGTAIGRRLTIPYIQANALASADFLRILSSDAKAEESPAERPKRRYIRKDMVAEA